MILPTSTLNNPGILSPKTQAGLSHLGPAEVRCPYVERTSQQYALRLVNSGGTLSSIGSRGGSLGMALTGPLLEFPEFLLGQRGKLQDGGSGGQRHRHRHRHREYWVHSGGSPQEQCH